MAEVEVRKTEPETGNVTTTSLDVNEIIGKIRDFVGNIKDMSSGAGEPMAVSVEGFNFAVGKADGEWDLTVKLNLAFKPMTAKGAAAQPF